MFKKTFEIVICKENGGQVVTKYKGTKTQMELAFLSYEKTFPGKTFMSKDVQNRLVVVA